MNKTDKLFEAIGDIDDSFIMEASRKRPKVLRGHWGLVASAACFCLVIASVVFLRSAGLLTPATQPTEPVTTPPTTTLPGDTTEPDETTLPPPTTQPGPPSVEEYFSERRNWQNCVVLGTFTDPAEVNLSYIFDHAMDGESVQATQLEQEKLPQLMQNYDPNRIFRATRAQMDEVLLSVLNITTDQLTTDWESSFAYLEETGCYYARASSTYGNIISIDRTETCEDGTVLMYYTLSVGSGLEPDRVARLQPHDDGYYILSNEYHVDHAGKTETQIAMDTLFGDTDSWYNRALACEYDTPEQLSLQAFFYCGFEGESRKPTDAEWAQLKDRQGFNENYDLFRLPASKMDEVLTQYFGIKLEDIPSGGFAGLEYLESTNCWYFMTTGGYGVENFKALTVETLSGGNVRVLYDAGYMGLFAVTLQPNGDGYRILSNVKAEETPEAELEVFNELFAVGSWFNRALTSRYRYPEKVSIATLFSCGFEGESTAISQEEWDALEGTQLYLGQGEFRRLPADKMNQVLTECFGITLEDIPAGGFIGLEYLESTDCWYTMDNGSVSQEFFATSAVTMDNGNIRVRYTLGEYQVEYAVTLQPDGDGYRILSNQAV